MREAGVRPDLYSYNTLLSACAAAAADARLPPRVGLRAVEQMREAFGVAPSAEVARARRRGPRPPNRRICAYNGGLAARSPPPAAHRHLPLTATCCAARRFSLSLSRRVTARRPARCPRLLAAPGPPAAPTCEQRPSGKVDLRAEIARADCHTPGTRAGRRRAPPTRFRRGCACASSFQPHTRATRPAAYRTAPRRTRRRAQPADACQ